MCGTLFGCNLVGETVTRFVCGVESSLFDSQCTPQSLGDLLVLRLLNRSAFACQLTNEASAVAYQVFRSISHMKIEPASLRRSYMLRRAIKAASN